MPWSPLFAPVRRADHKTFLPLPCEGVGALAPDTAPRPNTPGTPGLGVGESAAAKGAMPPEGAFAGPGKLPLTRAAQPISGGAPFNPWGPPAPAVPRTSAGIRLQQGTKGREVRGV